LAKFDKVDLGRNVVELGKVNLDQIILKRPRAKFWPNMT